MLYEVNTSDGLVTVNLKAPKIDLLIETVNVLVNPADDEEEDEVEEEEEDDEVDVTLEDDEEVDPADDEDEELEYGPKGVTGI